MPPPPITPTSMANAAGKHIPISKVAKKKARKKTAAKKKAAKKKVSAKNKAAKKKYPGGK